MSWGGIKSCDKKSVRYYGCFVEYGWKGAEEGQRWMGESGRNRTSCADPTQRETRTGWWWLWLT